MLTILLSIFCVIVAVSAIISISFCIYIHHIHAIYSHLPRPEPLHFFYGHVKLIQKGAKESSSTELFAKWHKQLGPIYVLHFFTRTVIVCMDSQVVKELLTRSKYLKSPTQYRGLISVYGARALGTGLVTETNHQAWMKKRALYNPAFHRKYLMGMMDQFNNSSDKLVEYLLPLADGKTEVDMLGMFERLTMEIIGKVGFGLEEEFILDADNRIRHLFSKILTGMQKVYREPFLKYSILYKDLCYKQELRDAVGEVRALGRKQIQSRITAMKNGEEVPRDILTYILQESDSVKGIKNSDMEDMIDEFMTFFGAGQETTANCMSFTLLHLGRNPDIMAKLRNEVDSVLGGRSFVEYSDIAKLQYMTLVLKESLRINPPVAMQTRLLPSNMELCGYKVQKGSVVMLPIYGMGRNEKHFKNPDVFDPERFNRDEDSPLFAFFPFSLGPRSCIGQTFAMIETKVIFCKLFQRLNFSLVPGHTMDFKEAVTLKPKDGCKNFISIRE